MVKEKKIETFQIKEVFGGKALTRAQYATVRTIIPKVRKLVKGIRESKNPVDAKVFVMNHFNLSPVMADFVLGQRLSTIAKLGDLYKD
jgi:DNA gyrase/topoisomerase IV subunit A